MEGHQSPAVKRIRDDFIQDARATPEIFRWAKPFAAILTVISPNGISRAAACDRKLAANPSNADFDPFFLLCVRVQLDRRTFRCYGITAPHFGLEVRGPLIADHLQQTRRLRGTLVGSLKLAYKPSWRRVGHKRLPFSLLSAPPLCTQQVRPHHVVVERVEKFIEEPTPQTGFHANISATRPGYRNEDASLLKVIRNQCRPTSQAKMCARNPSAESSPCS